MESDSTNIEYPACCHENEPGMIDSCLAQVKQASARPFHVAAGPFRLKTPHCVSAIRTLIKRLFACQRKHIGNVQSGLVQLATDV